MRTLVFVVTLLVVQSAAAAGNAVAGVGWRLDFGADSIHTGYGLSLGYRNAEHFAPLSHLIELNVDGERASANIAGFAITSRPYQASQSQADGAYDAGVDTRPWYSHAWVYWTVAGVGAMAALSGAASSGGSGNGEGSSSPNCETNGGGCGINCTNGTCTVPCTGGLPDCVTPGLRSRPETWLDDRDFAHPDPQGDMGDLIEVAQ